MSTIVLPADPRLRDCKPLKPKERPKNKFYVKDRWGDDVLVMEIQKNCIVIYPNKPVSKADLDLAFADLAELRKLLGIGKEQT